MGEEPVTFRLDAAPGGIRQFAVYPGANAVGRDRYAIAADGRDTGHDGVRVTYELPASVTASEVMSFYRANVPEGWTVATDAHWAPGVLHPPLLPTTHAHSLRCQRC